MAIKGPGSSAQSLTVLQRCSRLYEGERWWLLDERDEVRGLLLLDGGSDLAGLSDAIAKCAAPRCRLHPAEEGVPRAKSSGLSPRTVLHRPDCQVTVEERTQLFGFLQKR